MPDDLPGRGVSVEGGGIQWALGSSSWAQASPSLALWPGSGRFQARCFRECSSLWAWPMFLVTRFQLRVPGCCALLRPSISGSRLQFITLHVVFSFVPGGHARPTPTAKSGFRPSQLVVLCGEVLGASAGVLFLV